MSVLLLVLRLYTAEAVALSFLLFQTFLCTAEVQTVRSFKGVTWWNPANAAGLKRAALSQPCGAPRRSPSLGHTRCCGTALSPGKPDPTRTPRPSGLPPQMLLSLWGIVWSLRNVSLSLLLMRAGSAGRLRWEGAPGGLRPSLPSAAQPWDGEDLMMLPDGRTGLSFKAGIQRQKRFKELFVCAGVARPGHCVCVDPRSN